MKTFNNQTTLSSAARRTMDVANWLSSQNSLLTEYLGCRVSNLSFLSVIAFGVFAFAAFLLASDAMQQYGWAAFCALAAVNAVLPLINDFKKGGK